MTFNDEEKAQSAHEVLADFNLRYGQRLSHLESEVSNLKSTIDAVALTIRDISNKITDSQKAPWQTMIAAGTLIITVMSVVGLLSLQPITKSINDQNRRLEIMERREYDAIIDYSERISILEEKARASERDSKEE